MEESGDRRRRSRLIRKPQSLEDVPEELMHLIQSYILDPKEAARTCILSKSWLHAWSTIPTLRFREQLSSVGPPKRADQVMLVDRTLQRYLRDNIPFETIDLLIDDINNGQVFDCLAKRWIRPVATRTCVKELSLNVNAMVPYTLPGEIFSSENIRKISIANQMSYNLCICSNTMIKCVSLRVLELINVHIIEEVLDNLLSTCSLVEELKLSGCKGLKNIKVKNLRYLCKLSIVKCPYEDNLEIHDVPNLASLIYHSYFSQKYFHSFAKDSLGRSVTELLLQGVIIDEAFLDMIKLEFRLLQKLALDQIKVWSSESFNITCLSLKTLSLWFNSSPMLVKVQVFAPKLRVFKYAGKTKMPSLIFPAITPEQIRVILLYMDRPMDGLCFVKLREALMLPSNFDILISANFDVAVPLNIDFDDLRKRFPFPATNVQHLAVETSPKNSLFPEYSAFVDALFSIFHPKYVSARKENNYICNKLMMIKKAMEAKNTCSRKGSWADYLEGVEIENPHKGRDSSKSGIINRSLYDRVEFKLNWCRLS